MKKPNAVHTVTRSAARFGVPDPAEVCDLVANSVPLSILKEAEAILDMGQGCCGISRSVVKRLETEGYVDHFEAIFKVHGIDNDLALVKKAQRLGFINSECSDIDELDASKKYRVIVGNPPYQGVKTENGAKTPPLWKKFLAKAADLLEEGGYVSLLVPSQVAKFHAEGEPSPALRAVPSLGVVSIRTGMEVYFNVGTEISLITLRKAPQSDLILLNGESWNWKKYPFVPTVFATPERTKLLFKLIDSPLRFQFVNQPHSKPLTVDPSRSIGCWGMNRKKSYGMFDVAHQAGKERKAHIKACEFASEQEKEAALILFESPVYTFLKSMLMFGSDVSQKTVSGLPIPEGWQNLKSSDEVAGLFGLTEEEVQLLGSV